MTASMRRLLSSCFVLGLAVAGVALPAHAQAQYGQQQLVEGSHQWGQDGWCYEVRGGRLVRSNHFRVIPDPSNPSIYNLFENYRFVRQVNESKRGAAGSPDSTAAFEAQLRSRVDELNRMTAEAQARRPAPSSTGAVAGVPQPVLPADCPPFGGRLITHNVREQIPEWPRSHCRTPEEKAWVNNSYVNQLTDLTATRVANLCEARRSASPYRSSRRVNGVDYFTLDDGTEQPRGGTLNSGWMWGTNGQPVHRACIF